MAQKDLGWLCIKRKLVTLSGSAVTRAVANEDLKFIAPLLEAAKAAGSGYFNKFEEATKAAAKAAKGASKAAKGAATKGKPRAPKASKTTKTL